MHIFGCEDTTTVVMNYLTRKEIRPLLCINKDFYNIRNNGYYSIRVIQEFFKPKKIKCHENKHYCKKITLQDLYNNVNNYIGKNIQFILKSKNIGHNECIHNIMWLCKFGGTTRPYNNFNFRDKGIMAIHVGHVNKNIYNNCSCEHELQELNNGNIFTYFTEKYHHIYPHSIRIID